jgi:hypothetical protein
MGEKHSILRRWSGLLHGRGRGWQGWAVHLLLAVLWLNTTRFSYVVKPKQWDILPDSAAVSWQEPSGERILTHPVPAGQGTVAKVVRAQLRSGLLVGAPELPDFLPLFAAVLLMGFFLYRPPSLLVKKLFQKGIFHPPRLRVLA